jgi:phage-related protein
MTDKPLEWTGFAKFEEAVYVLHAFQKKTQKTARNDIELGQQRYQQMLQQRKETP